MPRASRAGYAEPRWESLFAPLPDLLIVIRPQAVRRDDAYGPVVRRAIELARAHSRLVAETGALEAMEDADEVIVGARDRGTGDADLAGRGPPDLVVVVRGVRANVDPASLVDEAGHALWRAAPGGPSPDVRELVRAPSGAPAGPATPADDDTPEASLFELPGRTWVVASGEARARARDVFSRSDGPGSDVPTPGVPGADPSSTGAGDPFDRNGSALAIMRLRGPALVARVHALRPPALLSPIGRGLSDLTIALPSGPEAMVRATLTYRDESAVALAESTVRGALEALLTSFAPRAPKDGDDKDHPGATSPEDYTWLRPATVRASRCCVLITVPLPARARRETTATAPAANRPGTMAGLGL